MFGKRPVKIAHPGAANLYSYHLGPRFDPGAMAEVFNAEFQLPLILARGAATLAGALRITQHPQVWFAQQSGVVGLGGLQAGQIFSQPLIDPKNF